MILDDVLEWLKTTEAKDILKDTARTGRTSIRKVRELPDLPQDATWYLDNSQELAKRLAASGLATPAAKTYASRVGTVIQGYLDWQRRPKTWTRPDRRMRREIIRSGASTVEEQLTDLHEFMGRWPDVREALWPKIVEIVGEKETTGTP